MRVSRRPFAHAIFESRAFRQTTQTGFSAITIDLPSPNRERLPYGLFDPQEAVGFERISEPARQASEPSKQPETFCNAALEDGARSQARDKGRLTRDFPDGQ